jgi:hypothetical protein
VESAPATCQAIWTTLRRDGLWLATGSPSVANDVSMDITADKAKGIPRRARLGLRRLAALLQREFGKKN